MSIKRVHFDSDELSRFRMEMNFDNVFEQSHSKSLVKEFGLEHGALLLAREYDITTEHARCELLRSLGVRIRVRDNIVLSKDAENYLKVVSDIEDFDIRDITKGSFYIIDTRANIDVFFKSLSSLQLDFVIIPY